MLNDCLKAWIVKTLSQNIYLWKIMYTVQRPWLIKVFVYITFTSSQASSGNCLASAEHVEWLVGLWLCVRVSDMILWIPSFTEVVSQKLHVYIIFSDFFIVSWVLLSIHGSLYTRDAGLIPRSWRSPGEGHGTRSSVLAWRIPGTEEPGRLKSMGSQRVRHDWNDWAHTQHLEFIVHPIQIYCGG